MNIDLLVTQKGEVGLLSSENLVKKAIGVLFDPEQGFLSFEFADMDSMDLNIPVEGEFTPMLDSCPLIHFGAVKDGKIAQAYQIPLMFLNDPYRTQAYRSAKPSPKPLAAFSYFIRACTLGQPVHRDDAGDESTMGCILGDSLPSALQFAPHLARRHTMEVAPSAAPHINAPGLGLGGSGSSGRTTYQTYRTSKDEDYSE